MSSLSWRFRSRETVCKYPSLEFRSVYSRNDGFIDLIRASGSHHDETRLFPVSVGFGLTCTVSRASHRLGMVDKMKPTNQSLFEIRIRSKV